jgi:cell division septal protein FtsQ
VSLKEDIEKVQKRVEEISLAREMIHEDQKKNKRLFIVLLVVLAMWFCTIVYLVYVLNDIGSTEETIDIEGVETIDNSHIKIGDDVWEKSK